jgi:effector-binding domain-containing protein
MVVNQVSEITVETIPEMTALVLPMTGSYEQHGEAILQVVTRAASTGIIRGAPFGVYHSNPEETPEDSLRWDICVPVAADAEAKPPFEVRKLPAMEAAVVTCTGPYEGTSPCYGALSAWLVPSGYQLGGSPQEHWLSDTRTTPPEMCVARILFPIVTRQR